MLSEHNLKTIALRYAYLLGFVCLAFIPSSFGQASWQWGRANKGGSMDSWAVAVDYVGNIYAMGESSDSSVYFDTCVVPYPFSYSMPNPQCVFSKYDNSGNVLWAKGIMTGPSIPVNITTDYSGNVVVLGIFQGVITIDSFTLSSNPAYPFQYFILKMDPSGNVIWLTASGSCSDVSIGFSTDSADMDLLTEGGICTDFSDNIYITGSFNTPTDTIGTTVLKNADTSGLSDDAFVAMYDPSGNPVWVAGLGGPDFDDPFGITVASTGNVYIAGTFNSDTLRSGPYAVEDPYVNQIAMIAEFSPTGAPLWLEAAGGAHGAYGAGLASDHSGNIFLTGSFGDSTICFGDTVINCLYPANASDMELYLVSFDMTNTVVWHKVIGSPTSGIAGFCIARGNTETGAVWVSGAWIDDASFFVNDSAMIDGQVLYTPDSSPDPVLMAGYDLSGGVVGYAALQSGADDQNGIACDGENNVYLCSDYSIGQGNTYFYVGPDTFLTSASLTEAEVQYLAKYGLSTTGIRNNSSGSAAIVVAPNPATESVTIMNVPGAMNYLMINMLGKEVMRGVLQQGDQVVDISRLSPGIYELSLMGKVQDESERINITIVKK